MLKLARKTETVELVTDLDELVSKPFAIRFKGKMHVIKPLNVQEFYALAKALSKLSQLDSQEEVQASDLVLAYYDLFSSVCDTITLQEVEQMEQSQIAAFLATILDRFVPKSLKPEEKKTLAT